MKIGKSNMMKYRITWFCIPFPIFAFLWWLVSWFVTGEMFYMFSTEQTRGAFAFALIVVGGLAGCMLASLYPDYIERKQLQEAEQRQLILDAEKLIQDYK